MYLCVGLCMCMYLLTFVFELSWVCIDIQFIYVLTYLDIVFENEHV